jgi:conjugal transfer/type IV secretion protein DotA/TraY
MRPRRFSLICLGLLACLAATTALAQTSSSPSIDFTPPSTDVSLALLQQLLGTVFGNSSTVPGSAMLGAFFRVLNEACMVSASTIFMYSAFVGVLSTAQDGQVLGRKWDSMWVPFRFVVFSALLVPMGSGFSLAQEASIAVAEFGVGVADRALTDATDALTSSAGYQHFTGNATGDGVVKSVIRQVFVNQVCSASLQLHYSEGDGANPPLVTTDGAVRIDYGGPANAADFSAAAPDACGSIGFTGAAPPPANLGSQAVAGFNALSNNAIINGIAQNASKTMAEGEIAGVQAANAIAARFATRYVQPCTVSAQGAQDCSMTLTGPAAKALLVQAMALAQQQYVSAVSQAQAQVAAQMTSASTNYLQEGFSSQLQQDGWMLAGAWFFRIAAIETELTRSVGFNPVLKDPNIDPDAALAMSGSVQFVDALDVLIGSATTSVPIVPSAAGQVPSTSVPTGLSIADPKAALNKLKAAMNPSVLISYVLGTTFGLDPTVQIHPLIQIKTLGDQILSYADGMFEGLLVLNTAAFLLGAAGSTTVFGVGVSGATTAIAGIVAPLLVLASMIISALFSAGIMMAIIIPLTPAITFLGGVAGWIISVVELLVVAPIAIAGHLVPEGHDQFGRGGAIYMVVLEVVARPILMVGGLILGSLLMYPVMSAFSYTFFLAASTVQAGQTGWSLYAVVTGLALMAMYVAVGHTLVKKCFSLIVVLPNAAFRVIGGQGSPHHDAAGDMGAAMERGAGRASAIAGASGAAIGRSSPRAAAAGAATNERMTGLAATAKEKIDDWKRRREEGGASAVEGHVFDMGSRGKALGLGDGFAAPSMGLGDRKAESKQDGE